MTTLTVRDLENVLREVAQLSSVTLKQPWPLYLPEKVDLSGAINIHGQPFFWETQIDLRDLNSREDIVTLIEQLLRSFDMAEKRGASL